MKIVRVVIPLILGAAMPTVVSGQSQTPTASSEISASGYAEVRLRPDHAVVNADIDSRNPSASGASSANATVTANVIQALKKAGLNAEEVTTSNFVVEQSYRYDERPPNSRPDGFRAHVTVRAETASIDQVPALIDAALGAGATRISVQYSSSKSADARLTALQNAFAAAKTDALALARAAGGSLGRLLSATPSGAIASRTFYDVQVAALSMTADAAPPPPLLPGNVSSSVTVSARWAFLPGGSQ